MSELNPFRWLLRKILGPITWIDIVGLDILLGFFLITIYDLQHTVIFWGLYIASWCLLFLAFFVNPKKNQP